MSSQRERWAVTGPAAATLTPVTTSPTADAVQFAVRLQ